ncbi:hypothetical protein [Oceanobacillus profundus]|uniref:Uncharacterized protein n=1 Tax=Oceanobacillus profundus TaxID=372463 RepID=A0A417YGT9_9BACI|nr:hypothetical protein [Oceanobacillus profundus]MBR2245626.1 hypothetical protein [Bacilli bacterium]MBR3121344.1 hypothetical protein [Oceanobacillus sp.]RHW32031.1 hypothetical protein D1B32_12415 [Oceanobacillus profundus]
MNKIDRDALREQYEKTRIKRVDLNANSRDVYGNEDMMNLPRHQTNCPSFVECPIDYKCRNYNPTYVACVTCPLHKTDGICHKKELHNEKTYNMIITRQRVDIDKIDAIRKLTKH